MNREEVLKRLPDQDSREDRQNQFDAVIVDHLKELRGSAAEKAGPSQQKRLRLNIVSGKAVGDDSEPEDAPELIDLAMEESFPMDEPNDSRRAKTKPTSLKLSHPAHLLILTLSL